MKQEKPSDAFEALDVIAADSTDRPTKRQVENVAAQSKKRAHWGIGIACAASLLIGIAGVVIGSEAGQDAGRVGAQVELQTSAIDSLKEANEKLIAKGIAPIPLPADGNAIDANALAQAAAALVLADPRFAGLTLADLRRQVDDYFRVHPLPEGQKPTTEQVTTAVAGIYAANPPAPGSQGRPPTAAEIFTAVSDFCSNDACRGPAGQNGANGTNGTNATGEPGRPPTKDEIDASVKGYCESTPNSCSPEGPPGSNGAPGEDAPRPIFAEFKLMPDCRYITTYLDADGVTEYPVSAPVPPEMCGQ